MTRTITTETELDALPVGAVIRSQRGAVALKQDATDYPWVFADETQARFTNIGMIDCHTWPFAVLYEPGKQARPLPDRDEIAEAIDDVIGYLDLNDVTRAEMDTAIEQAADAVLALLTGKDNT